MALCDNKERDLKTNKISLVEEIMLSFTNDFALIELINNSSQKDSLLQEEIYRRLPAIMTDEELYFEMKNN